MSFVIGSMALDGKLGIEISEQEYLEARHAHAVTFFALRIEEKFDLMVSNYQEYETELLKRTLNRSLYSDDTWSSFLEDINAINRRLLNLLTGGRFYIQHLLHDTSSTFKPSTVESEALKEVINAEYDTALGYRVGEALRNYIQHRGSPVTGLNFPNRHDGKEIRAQIMPVLHIERLKQDGHFKQSVLTELKEIGSKLNVTVFMRQYAQSIAKIHHALQDIIERQVNEADQNIEKTMNRARAEYENLTALVVARVGEEFGGYVDELFVRIEPIKRREDLKEKNRATQIISNWYVSGKCSLISS